MEQKEFNNIEWRSEKVRRVIGEVPPFIVRMGAVIITIIVLAVIFVGIISIKKAQWE